MSEQVKLGKGKLLHVPVENDAPVQHICVKAGTENIFEGAVRLSQTRIDAWMCIYLPETAADLTK